MSQDKNFDKQIQQLLQIKLGLEQRAQSLFKDLTANKSDNPLDNLIESMMKKNSKIRQLQENIIKLQKENTQYKKREQKYFKIDNLQQKGINVEKQKSSNQRTKSLPNQHQLAMQGIGEKKDSLQIEKKKYIDRSQSFVIFLIKCLKQISKSKIQKGSDVQKLVDNLKKDLDNFKNKSSEREQKQSNNVNKSQQNSTMSLRNQEIKSSQNDLRNQRLQQLRKQLSKQTNPQVMFSKINQKLGLKQTWDNYIGKLKQQSDMFNKINELLFSKQRMYNLSHQKSWQKFKEQMQIFKQKIKNLKNSSQWALQVNQNTEKIISRTSENQTRNFFNQIMHQTKQVWLNDGKQVHKLIFNSIQYIFEKLDKTFQKHNQNPYQICTRKSYLTLQQRVTNSINNKQWDQVFQSIKNQVDQMFYFIQRRTKFYSCNRVLIRGNK